MPSTWQDRTPRCAPPDRGHHLTAREWREMAQHTARVAAMVESRADIQPLEPSRRPGASAGTGATAWWSAKGDDVPRRRPHPSAWKATGAAKKGPRQRHVPSMRRSASHRQTQPNRNEQKCLHCLKSPGDTRPLLRLADLLRQSRGPARRISISAKGSTRFGFVRKFRHIDFVACHCHKPLSRVRTYRSLPDAGATPLREGSRSGA